MVVKKLGKLGQTIFDARYSYPGENGYSDRCKSMAKHVASCEKDDQKEDWTKKFYDALSTGDFIPGGRIIFGAGRNKQNLLNCYAIEPEDNVESIGKTIQDMYRISCGGGGIGFNFSKIRPKGDDIGNIKNSAPGSVSTMKMINEIANHVKAGKNRRSALMSELNVDHPDLFEFLSVKLDRNELTNFNISVAITDDFIKACKENKEWSFKFNNKEYNLYHINRVKNNSQDYDIISVPATSEEDAVLRAKQHYLNRFDDKFENPRKVKLFALDIWNDIWKNAVESGEPGIFNLSLVNKFTNVSYFLQMNQSNPCGEIPLESYANCCLGHINLSNILNDDNSDVDWKRLAKTIRVGTRYLDNVLTVNHYPIEECKIAGERSRRVGLGTLGLHHMLIKLGMKYGDDKCLEFLDRLYATIRNETYLASSNIAKEKGSFPEFDVDKFLEEGFAKELPTRIRLAIKENGIRNALLLTAAPTGTISMVHETSTGIEPIFAPMYRRRYREGNVWAETTVLDPLFKQYLVEGKNAEHIVGAYDVTPEQHMAVQAVIQKYIDNSISKTINLPKNANEYSDSIAKIALNYAPYLKGITVYRASSRGEEPLQAIPLTPENIQMAKDLIAKEQAESGNAIEVCKIGGECGA